MNSELKIENIRDVLIRLEETIIFHIIERSQFLRNGAIYIDDFFNVPGNSKTFLDFFLRETESVHAKAGRYTSPDEEPFSESLPDPFWRVVDYAQAIDKNEININSTIKDVYINDFIPLITKEGDDKNYGSSAVNDIAVLQALSKRIHYGKYVAESKYQDSPEIYNELIENNDNHGIMDKLTYISVEKKLLERVFIKASTYGQDPFVKEKIFKVNPEVIVDIYEKFIIPLTKDVEVMYLLKKGI